MASRGEFKESLYHGSFQGLVESGVPENLARQVSEIAATDDYSAPNLGRTEEQQHLVQSAMTWLKAWKERGGRR